MRVRVRARLCVWFVVDRLRGVKRVLGLRLRYTEPRTRFKRARGGHSQGKLFLVQTCTPKAV